MANDHPSLLPDGFPVLSLLPDSKAQRAGILVGDIIIGVNGQRVTKDDPEGYGTALKLKTPATFDIIRNGQYHSITLEG